jgi:ParB family chromosome partitioning protein
MQIEQIPWEQLRPDPHNPRQLWQESETAELAESLKRHGQRVPCIGYKTPEGVVLVDGHRRRAAAQRAGIRQLAVMILPAAPAAGDLLLAQLTVNCQRRDLAPVDLYEAFTALARHRQWNGTQLAQELGLSNATVARVLALGKLTAEERATIRAQGISGSAAYAVARAPQEERQSLLDAAGRGELNRDQLTERTRKRTAPTGPAVRRLTCPLRGATISIAAAERFDLATLIGWLEELAKECKKGKNQGWDVKTLAQVLSDRAKVVVAE